jgi:hypothetical protein
MNVARSKSRNVASTVRRAKVLTTDSMNPKIKAVQYAVRGPIVIRAGQIQDEINAGKKVSKYKI